MSPPVTHRHDEAPVLRSVLLIGDFLHQSVKLRLRVPKDPHLIGFLVELIQILRHPGPQTSFGVPPPVSNPIDLK